MDRINHEYLWHKLTRISTKKVSREYLRHKKAQKDIRGTGYQDVDIRISEYQVAVLGTPPLGIPKRTYGGHQGNRDFDMRRTV